jgi:hypothetical protein
MDCARFEALLFVALDAAIDPAERAWMARHEQGCADCQGLAALLEDRGEPPLTALFDDFATAVVMRTSGKPCAQVSAMLAGSAEGPVVVDALLELHLASCADCTALAGALRQLQQELPTLAETEPDAPLVSAVLAATLGPRRPEPAGVWLRLARRPRLALEGSFVIASLALLIFGLPDGLSEWSASATNALDRSAQSVWDDVLRPRSESLRSLWNEIPSGIVEPGITE